MPGQHKSNSTQLSLQPSNVRTWKEVEELRLRYSLPGGSGGGGSFSQAELCRRAGISASTYSKGKKNNTPIMKSRLRWIRAVLEGQRHLLLSEGVVL